MRKRGIFLGKKGQEMESEVYHIIIQIFILVMVFISMSLYLKSVKENTLFEKIYLSRDLALLMNTIYVGPENVGAVYAAGTTDLSKYNFEANDNYIEVNEKGTEFSQKRYYKYASDLNVEEDFPIITDSKIITFIKDDNFLNVDYSGTGSLNKLICEKIDIETRNWKNSIIIDPGHGDSNNPVDPIDTGFVTDDIQESRFTTRVSDVLRQVYGYDTTRNSNYYLNIDDRLEEISDYDVVISIHLGNHSSDKNIATAFISTQSLKKTESRSLSCLILNNLIDIGIDNVAIIPEFISELDENDPKQVLSFDDKIAVLLEIGNINNQNSVELLDNEFEIATAINNALEAYYE